MTKKIIIIGAGQAAVSCAGKLRNLNQDDQIMIIGDEPSLPYQRPPLSKQYLSGDYSLERLYLKPLSWYDQQNIELRTHTKVIALDATAKSLRLENDEIIAYDRLVFATGSRPRNLPNPSLKDALGVYTVRNLADIDKMRGELVEGRKLCVIGGGYIGLEATAIARKFGVEVTLIEVAPSILGRVACPATADYMRDLHKRHGVTIIEGVGIEDFIQENGRIAKLVLANGVEIAADFIIIGIGAVPNSELAQNADIICDQGIIVDEYGLTSDPYVYAIGDVARLPFQGQLIRIESVGHAIDHGELVAVNIAGNSTKYQPKAWFWSDQYDCKLQIAGLNIGYDATVTRLGSKPESISVWYYKQDRLIAVDAMNDPRAYMVGKKLIEAGKNVAKAIIGDPQTDLKAL